MTDDRLPDVLRISREALERDGAERGAYLDAACGADADLRGEVEALLAEPSAGSGSLLDTPPWAPPALKTGQRLGPYEISGLLGAGGMGTVYKARDTRLQRTVALKVLSGVAALDPAARERFMREAHAIAALDHPHICTLYDVGRDVPTDPAGGRLALPPPSGESGEAERGHVSTPRGVAIDYIVMEHLEGETLAKRLAAPEATTVFGSDQASEALPQPLPIEEALAIGIQIADALSAAQRHGIVHRDLKPANVMLMTDGDRRGVPMVKLLDFGLAKPTRPAGGPADDPWAFSTRDALTIPGAVLGTVPYMAPEQLEGKEVDARTDLFAFGCVLYEMLTGRRAFAGDTGASVISAIMSGDPAPVSSAQPAAPPALDDLVRRCLAKDRGERWPSAADVAERLSDISQDLRPRAGGRTAWARGWRGWAFVGALVLLAAAAIGWVVIGQLASPRSSVVRATLTMPGRTAIAGASGSCLAVAPDGSGVVYRGGDSGRIQLYWNDTSGGDGWALPGTEGATSPFLSPNARWLGFWRGEKLLKLPLRSGRVVEGSEATEVAGLKKAGPGRGAAWTADGSLVYAVSGSGLWYVPANGPEARPLTQPDPSRNEIGHGWPSILPDGRNVLFTILDASGRFDRSAVALLSLDTGRWTRVIEGGAYARYLPSGHLVFARKGTLLAVPFDAAAGRTTGSPMPVLTDVGFLVNHLTSAFDVTRDGTLVYAVAKRRALENALVWVGREGGVEPVVPERRFYSGNQQAVSSDGQRLATVVYDDPYDSIWIYHLQERRWHQITLHGDCHFPLWSPDGDRLVFNSNRDGAWNLYVVTADGEGAPERLTRSGNYQWPYAWSPDGRFVAYQESNPDSSGPGTMETWILPLDAGSPPWRWGPEGAQVTVPTFSPDGRWLAYQSRESGTWEVYARPFPGPGPKQRLSGRDGGLAPSWSLDGREIFYMTRLGDNRIMSRRVASSSPLRLADSRVAFALPFRLHAPMDYHSRAFSVTPDGRRVVVMQTDERTPDRVNALTVIRGWPEEVRAKLSALRSGY